MFEPFASLSVSDRLLASVLTLVAVCSCSQDDKGGELRFESDAARMIDGEVDAHVSTNTDASVNTSDARVGRGCVMGSGAQHTCARLEAGSLWCWGSNSRGQLGMSSEVGGELMPKQLSSLGNEVDTVALGTWHSCATKSDGSLWCWGENEHGTIGNGSFGENIYTPTKVEGLSNVAEFGVGVGSSCAREESGAVYCWGHNWVGQIGDGTKEPRAVPTPVSNLGTDNETLAVGGNAVACVIKTGGELWCWGNITGNSGEAVTVPTKMETFGENNAAVDISNFTICTLKTDATLWCNGINTYGQVTGDGTTGESINDARQITSVPGTIENLSLLGASSCVRTASSDLYCWGNNDYGQVGIGTKQPTYTPTLVSSLEGRVARADGGGWNHVCVREEDGSIWCWGNNNSGQLGDGTNEDQPLPVRVDSIVCPPSTLR